MTDGQNTRAMVYCKYLFVITVIITTHVCRAQGPWDTSLPPCVLSRDSLLSQVQNGKSNQEDIAGYVFQSDFNTTSSGVWKRLPEGSAAWFLKVRIPDAAGVSVVLTELKLDQDAQLLIYGHHEVKGPFHRGNIPSAGVLPIDYIAGDELIVQLNVPLREQRNYLVIEAVSFTDNQRLFMNSPASSSSRSAECYTCFTGDFWNKLRRSIVKIVTFRDGEAIMCTGVLVNNTAQNAKPYILTAQHCITTQEEADRSVVMFNHDNPGCGQAVALQRYSMMGATLRATSFDFTLLELNDHIPLGAHPYFAGWNTTDRDVDRASCIHHPLGGVKEISLAADDIKVSDYVDKSNPQHVGNAFWHVQRWSTGVTEGGSSGAPLFNGDQKIIGTLTGGESTCGYPYHDYFERLSVAWSHSSNPSQQLQHWLDPTASGQQVIDGWDPFENMTTLCDTLSNIQPDENIAFMPGCNTDSITEYAELFEGQGLVTGVQFYLGSINPDAPGGVTVSVVREENGLPGASIAQVYFPYAKLQLYFNYLELYPYVPVSGRFFITYTLDCSVDTTFAIGLASWSASRSNTAFAKIRNAWQPLSNIRDEGKNTSLYISPIICYPIPTSDTKEELNAYPNPASGQVIITLPNSESNVVTVHLYTVSGVMIPCHYETYSNNVVVNTSSLAGASYILRITTPEKPYVVRFIKF